MPFIDRIDAEDNVFSVPCAMVQEKYNRDIKDLTDSALLSLDEIFVVWYNMETKENKLHNWRALITTDRVDGRYYELTHNEDNKNTVIEVYVKESKEIIPDTSR